MQVAFTVYGIFCRINVINRNSIPLAFNFSCTEVIDSTLRLISLNVRGISNFKKRWMIYTWCKKKNTDIIFLQETHSTKEVENQRRNEWDAEIIMSHGTSNSRGVAVLIKKGLEVIVHSKIMDPQGRFIILKIEFNDNLCLLINVYAPNKDKDSVKFFRGIKNNLTNRKFRYRRKSYCRWRLQLSDQSDS